MFRLTRDPIDVNDLRAVLARPDDGAIVVFEGVVRNRARGKAVRHLEYHAYESMAVKELEKLCLETKRRFDIRDLGIVHRLGRLECGECSVAIVVVAEHRGPAFEACRYAIDTLKMSVPIWKKEFFEDCEAWVEGG